jgi:MoaA/NifB/PqqE/SkfB family radical SAM enzyme
MPPQCNYNCVGCFSTRRNRSSGESLSLEETFELIDQARELGISAIEISGEGEPLMQRERLEEIIDHANNQGIITTLFTNGSLLTRDFIDYIAERNCSLAISLDYLDRELFDENICNRHAFDDVMRNIEYARDVFSRYIEEENGYRVMRFAIHSILDSTSINQIPAIRDFCREDIFYSVAPYANIIEQPELELSDEVILDTINQYSDGSLIVSESAANEVGFPVCGTFFYGIGITHEGEILFDAHAFDTRGMIGNIRNCDLRELIHRQRCMRDRFYQNGASHYCPLRDPNYQNILGEIQCRCRE